MGCYSWDYDYYDKQREARMKVRRAKLIKLGLNPKGNKFMRLMMRP